ncbi:hypothetical protein ABFT23_07045 [Nocardioides sp. C4-1]|uniref:hypothetical protein n=1 Tax=Nocardioides sp. C4-1 TaxID=3151851 RepID=UPI0032674986
MIDPPLEPGEVAFLASFTTAAGVRRVWPGQPGRRCPWRPTPDGRRLLLEAAVVEDDADVVASWLRFLSREFLAPSSAASLDTALNEGLRGGHRLQGAVLVGDHVIRAELNRVTQEQVPPPERDAQVLELKDRRAEGQSTER